MNFESRIAGLSLQSKPQELWRDVFDVSLGPVR